jgi:hypothetical protein
MIIVGQIILARRWAARLPIDCGWIDPKEARVRFADGSDSVVTGFPTAGSDGAAVSAVRAA